MIRHYFKIAIRNLLKYKMQNIISIVGISIGFTAFLLGGYWYYWEHRFDTFHPDWQDTYAITTTGLYKTIDGGTAELNQFHSDMIRKLQALPEISSICNVSDLAYVSEGKEKSWMGLNVDSTFFRTFQCRLTEGTYEGNAYDGNSAIITQKTSRYLFGDSSCIGKDLKINENTTFRIVGVMEDYPGNTNFKFDYLLLTTPQMNNQQRFTTYVRVHQNTDINNLSKKISGLRMDKEDTEFTCYSNWHFKLRSLPDVHICCSPELGSRFRNLQILAVAGLLAFVSAMMNLLVIFIGQQQRKVRCNITFFTLGASFREMVGKNILELLLTLSISFILSMALFEFIFPFYQDYTHLEAGEFYNGIIQQISGNEVLRMAFILYPTSIFLFLVISIFPIAGLLKRKQNASSRLLRNGLILGQIFIGSLFFIISLAFYSQFRFMIKTDKGIRTDNIWQIQLGFDAVYAKDCTPFATALRSCPYIEDVTALSTPVLSPNANYYCSYITHFDIDGRDKNGGINDNCIVVEKNFFTFFGMKMKEGEWLADNGTIDIVVNETGSRKLNIPSLVGRKIEVTNKTDKASQIISGILADYYYCPMQYPIDKVFFRTIESTSIADHLKPQYYYIKIKAENREKALAFAHKLYPEYDKGEITPEKQIIYLPKLMEEFNRPEKTMFYVFMLLASVCILISSFGIYSLVALSTEQRKKEIAIRKVNGAVFKDILKLFLKEYLWLTLSGNAIALLLGYIFIEHWLATYAYHITLNIGLFIIVLLITNLIVVFSVTRQVILAAKINPAESVKSE